MAGRDERRTRQVPVEARHATPEATSDRYGQRRARSSTRVGPGRGGRERESAPDRLTLLGHSGTPFLSQRRHEVQPTTVVVGGPGLNTRGTCPAAVDNLEQELRGRSRQAEDNRGPPVAHRVGHQFASEENHISGDRGGYGPSAQRLS